MPNVLLDISVKDGFELQYNAALDVATNVFGDVIILLFLLIFIAW